MNSEMENTTTQKAGPYRPKLTFYHPNAKGTGCAVTMDLHPAHEQTDGSIMMRAANQMTIGNRMGPNPVFPRFDWEGAICVKLDFNDLCAMLQVFRGECESINGEHGLYHRTAKASTKIVLRHLVDPVAGYSLELYRTASGGEETRAHLLFSSAEALGLCEAISGAMYLVCFGMPMVLPHDTSAYLSANRRPRDVVAA